MTLESAKGCPWIVPTEKEDHWLGKKDTVRLPYEASLWGIGTNMVV